MVEPVVVSWSGGKDSCVALHETLRSDEYRVESLLTTVAEGHDRVSMHGVRRELLHSQADSLGLPLREVVIPQNASNEIYEARMEEALSGFRSRGITTSIFGDLFLEDIREYREAQLARAGMRALFPVWGTDTREFAESFIELGYEAIVVCLDPKKLDESFAGKLFDNNFLEDLPSGVDPCGENGEFHTFVFDGPVFAEEIPFRIGESVERDGFFFTDLVPK
ncbi:MAG: diphthine--ammonia ligase [Rubrobacteraceae bacterium]